MGFRRNAGKVAEAPKQEVTKTVVKAAPAVKSSGGGKTFHNDVLQVNESKDGGYYVKINELKAEGLTITVNGKTVTGFISKDPMVQLEESVAAGRLTEERAQEIADKIPTFVKANVTIVTE